MKTVKIKRALLSVSDKEGIIELAAVLKKHNVEIISSGGTAKVLTEAGIEVTPIQNVTGNPEAFGGRMKTLSFQVSSALLYRRGNAQDEQEARQLNIEAIDLVVCNLYPFSEVAKRDGQWDELIENIDIGGPTMVRASAKNHESVAVLTSPVQYDDFIEAFKQKGETTLEMRKDWALRAYQHTAQYDGMIASELEERLGAAQKTIFLNPERASTLRYGENPHQCGYVYRDHKGVGLAHVEPLQGKALSYNNLLDADAAWRSLSDMNSLKTDTRQFAVTVIKHSNPCGASLASSAKRALQLAWNGDPVSSFGSIICFNHEVTQEQAVWLSDKFVEVLIAPGFSSGAREQFAKKKNLRLLVHAPATTEHKAPMVRSIDGGWVVQEEDNGMDHEFQSMTRSVFPAQKEALARFGIFAGKHLKSNAIVLVGELDGDYSLVGAGMGNPNRLVSLAQAHDKARDNGHNHFGEMVLISDAFFPFRDNIDLAGERGIKYIVQPGGSIKDQEVIQACDELGIAMAFTGRRHFRH